MGREGRVRHCECLICGQPGKSIEDHEWKEHMRQLRLAKKSQGENEGVQNSSSHLMFGLAVNDQLGHERLNHAPLWGSTQLDEASSDIPIREEFEVDPEDLTVVFSHLSAIPPRSQDIMITVREKKNSLQRKLDRALSHISHHRNMKKLVRTQRALVSLEARFDQALKNQEVHQSIDDLEALLSSVALESNSVHGKTPPVKKLRDEINSSVDVLTVKIQNWRLENGVTLASPQPAIYDMGAYFVVPTDHISYFAQRGIYGCPSTVSIPFHSLSPSFPSTAMSSFASADAKRNSFSAVSYT